MSPETRPPGLATRAAATVVPDQRKTTQKPTSPDPDKSQALTPATAASRQETLGWPQREPVSDTAAERAGSASAAREALFVRRGLMVAGPGAAARALMVKIKVGDRIGDALPLLLEARR